MGEIQRICIQCGHGNSIEARYCAKCGFDSQSNLPAPRANLPAVIGQAALPVLIGVGGWAMRAGWRLLQQRLTQAVTPVQSAPPAPTGPAAPTLPAVPVQRVKRTIRIRSSWAVNQGDGVWRQGMSDQTIELDD
jgi:hypothetical protein